MSKSDNQSPCLTRRAALGSAIGISGLLALGGAVRLASARPLVRPPGVTNEADFQALCIRCDRCRSVCPKNIIRQADITDGLIALRTPVLRFHHGACDFCNRCIAVCPTGALSPYEGETTVIGRAELTDNCIALRTGACSKCVKACPQDAITTDAKRIPVVDTDKCNGCGECEAVCPANILQSYHGSAERGIVVRAIL